MEPSSLYIHVPFCRAKCNYCDFNSYPGLEALYEDYAHALGRELAMVDLADLRTVYVGGGTPTVLPAAFLARLLRAVAPLLSVDAEVSIEANPGTVHRSQLASLRAAGVTRLSLGVQSFSDHELQLLGRIHTAEEARLAFRNARRAGFENINLDLIYGLPGQSQKAWQSTLELALALQPEHLSLYALTVEPDTPLSLRVAQGVVPDPDPDLAAGMYEQAQESLARAGYQHYEISNWARDEGCRCRHNLVYWRNEPYLGLGAGAHSWAGGRRWANVAAPGDYVSRLLAGRRPVESEESIERGLEMGETMMMGLRLVAEGVAFRRFAERFGVDLGAHYADEVADLQALGLIARDTERIRLTRRGRLLGNQAFLSFLPD